MIKDFNPMLGEDEKYYVVPVYKAEIKEGKLHVEVNRRCNRVVNNEIYDLPVDPARFVDSVDNDINKTRQYRTLDQKDFADPSYILAYFRARKMLIDLVGEEKVSKLNIQSTTFDFSIK